VQLLLSLSAKRTSWREVKPRGPISFFKPRAPRARRISESAESLSGVVPWVALKREKYAALPLNLRALNHFKGMPY